MTPVGHSLETETPPVNSLGSQPPALSCPEQFNPKYINRAWALITQGDGAPREVRILKTEKGTVSGIFTRGADVAKAIEPWNGVQSIYLTVNPLRPEMLARANVGKLSLYTRDTTTDGDIASRTWIIIDIDPKTPVKGVSATDVEQAYAIEARDILAGWLRSEYGFPEPVRGQSGNGGRLLYRIELPNDTETTDLIKRCLKALALTWDSAQVEIDKSVFNASRIDKVWGTLAVKGTATDDRPHRRAYLDRVPKVVGVVTRGQLEELAAMVPASEPRSSMKRAGAGADFPRLFEAIQTEGLYLKALDDKHYITCPWKDAHTTPDTETGTEIREPSEANNFAGGFKCQHSHCAERRIGDLYARFVPRVDVAEAPPVDVVTDDALIVWGPVYDVATWNTWDVPKVEFIVQGLLPRRGTMWVSGLPKQGKSLFVLYTGLCLACQRKTVADHFDVLIRKRILYVVKEDSAGRVQERIGDILSAWDGATPEPGFFTLRVRPSGFDLSSPSHFEQLREECQKAGAQIVVIDTWTASSVRAAPQNPQQQSQLAQGVVQLAQNIDGLVIVVDHTRKNRPDGTSLSSADIYGPSQKWQAAETILMLAGTQQERRLEAFIEGKDADTQRVFLDVSPRGSGAEKFTYGGSVEAATKARVERGQNNRERIFDVVAAAGDKGLTRAQVMTAVDLGKSAVADHLSALVKGDRVRTKQGIYRVEGAPF